MDDFEKKDPENNVKTGKIKSSYDFVKKIVDSDQVETFVNALEACANDKTPHVHVKLRELTDENEILERLEQRKRNKANGTK